MAASANVSALLVALRNLAPGVSDGPGGNVLGPDENVTDDDIQAALVLTWAVIQLRKGINLFEADEIMSDFVTAANWYEGISDTVLSVSFKFLGMLTHIAEAQRVA